MTPNLAGIQTYDLSRAGSSCFRLWYTFAIIVLPLVTLGFELNTGISAQAIFDPIPTGFHVLAVAWVPAAGLWLGVMRFKMERAKRFCRLSTIILGVALGISFFYTLAYLPFTPIALLSVLFLGAGLLPLSPLLSFIALCQLRSGRRAEGLLDRPVILLTTAFLGFALLLISHAHTFASWKIIEAIEPDGTTTAFESFWLRRVVGEKPLGEAAQRGWFSGPYDDFLGHSYSGNRDWKESESALRNAYYRIFDGDWTSVKNGSSRWDQYRGEKTVGPLLPGLSLIAADWTTKHYPEERAAYGEWTLVFQNEASFSQEARAVVELPPGGVVSRATLWVNGEAREAVYSSPGKVTEAYKSVAVRQRRDPLLVTWRSPDRVFVQCFPVLPDQTMQIRIGISFPATTQVSEKAPTWVEQNFHLKGFEQKAYARAENVDVFAPEIVFDGHLVVSLSERDTSALPEVARLVERHRLASPVWIEPLGRFSSASEAAHALRNAKISGGTDAVPMLLEALRDVKSVNGRIRWIAGSQAVKVSKTSAFAGTQANEVVEVWRMPATLNRLVEQAPVNRWNQVQLVSYGGQLLPFNPSRTQYSSYSDVVIDRLQEGETDRPAEALGTFQAIMQAWRLQRQWGSGSESAQNWGQLAAAARLVTPWSGAVVLETDQQYIDQGLKAPEDKASSSAIPEPAMMGLLINGVLVTLLAFRRRRR